MYEVAKIEGATAYETFWKVTIPSILHILLFVVIYTIVDQFTASFNPILEVITHHSINISTGYGYASAIAWLYFLVILLVLLAVILIFRKSLGLTVQRKEKRA